MNSPVTSMPTPKFGLRKNRSIRAFSLTEIAIALATVSVSLVALLGLVSVSLKTGQSSAQETCLASASRQVLDALRSRDFEDLRTNEIFVEPPQTSDETQPTVLPTIYLSDDGQWLAPDRDKWPEPGKPTVQPANAVYQCVVEVEPDVNTLTSNKLTPHPPTRVNMLRVKLALGQVVPANAPSPSANSTVLIHATLPRQ
jgi:type II secretory pathway pseudopilin PulG